MGIIGDDTATGDGANSSSLTLLGGGDGVVWRVVVDSTGLVVCEPLEREEEVESASTLLCRCCLSWRPRIILRSAQSIPFDHVA